MTMKPVPGPFFEHNLLPFKISDEQIPVKRKMYKYVLKLKKILFLNYS
jgi:hypothetical protein